MKKVQFERGAGVLCHISSLPNKYGIGSLGKEAYDFVDTLSYCGVKYWQILPLVQTGYGDSPYQSVCCNSGNPYFIDLAALKNDGLLTEDELKDAERECGKVDYGALYVDRYKTLRAAYARFNKDDAGFKAFVAEGEFDDYALFMSLKGEYNCTFDKFPEKYKFKREDAISAYRKSVFDTEYCFWQFLQYEFYSQWSALKAYANGKGIKIIGDIPLYVAYDSADVWGKSNLFALDEELRPEAVAGVPPDYFSEDGQLWGNPLYNWEKMEEDGFNWWVNRIAGAQMLYDVVRIDHFRGLDRYYTIPADAKNARIGEWKTAPGFKMLQAAEDRLGALPVIAEDLGVIDDGVIKLIKDTNFPSMKVLMFAFDGNADNAYLPEFITENTVTYTGTHDNDTALGFIEGMDEKGFKQFVTLIRKTLKKQNIHYPVVDKYDCVRALCMIALSTKSDIAVIPVQDWLKLDNGSRMNTPSTASGNWQFRLTSLPTLRQKGVLRRDINKFNR